MDGATLCGAKPAAGEHGPRGGCLAMVEPLASGAWQPGGTVGRRAAGAAASLAPARSDRADRSRVGGVPAFGGARCSFWRGVLAGANRKAVEPSIQPSCSRPSWQASPTRIKIPAPFCSFPKVLFQINSSCKTETLPSAMTVTIVPIFLPRSGLSRGFRLRHDVCLRRGGAEFAVMIYWSPSDDRESCLEGVL